jgi:hypothetical protein
MAEVIRPPSSGPAARQPAPGNHQRRHHQQEQGDRHLHSLDGGVQVLADVVDHHVHVRAGEAADELRQGEGHEDGAQHTGGGGDRMCVHGVTCPVGGRPGRVASTSASVPTVDEEECHPLWVMFMVGCAPVRIGNGDGERGRGPIPAP